MDVCEAMTSLECGLTEVFVAVPVTLEGVTVGIPSEYFVEEMDEELLLEWKNSANLLRKCGAKGVLPFMPARAHFQIHSHTRAHSLTHTFHTHTHTHTLHRFSLSFAVSVVPVSLPHTPYALPVYYGISSGREFPNMDYECHVMF